MSLFAEQLFLLRWAQGRLEELVPATSTLVEQYPELPAWRAALAFLYAELDRENEARAEFEFLAMDDFALLPRDGVWILGIYLLAETCVYLRDSDRASKLHDLLLPYAEYTVTTAPGAVCLGSAASILGPLAAVRQRWTEAATYFDRALDLNRTMGARPMVVRTLEHYAQMLLVRDEPGDRERAVAFTDQAVEIAQELGMANLAQKLEADRAHLHRISAS